MLIWTIISVTGGILSLAGLIIYTRKFIRGEITRMYLIAIIIGYISFIIYIIATIHNVKFAREPISIAVLLPAFIALIIIMRDNQKSK